MKTFAPDLDPAVLERLREYAARFAPDFPQSKPARWAGIDIQGLLLDGEHHHATMVLLAYGFLLLEQARPRPEPTGSGKKGTRSRR